MQQSTNKTHRRSSLQHEKPTKTSVSLTQLKKTTQQFPLLHTPSIQNNPITTFRHQTKSKGKLKIGLNTKPIMILSKE